MRNMFQKLLESARFRKFSNSSKRVLAIAEEEAKAAGSIAIGSEHILLGISITNEELGSILASYGASPTSIRNTIASIVGPSSSSADCPKLSPRAQIILDRSAQETRIRQSKLIHPEHLLLAILHEESGIGARVLDLLSVDFKRLEGEIVGTTELTKLLVTSDLPKGVNISDAIRSDILARGNGILGRTRKEVLKLLGDADEDTENTLTYKLQYESVRENFLRLTILFENDQACSYELFQK